MAHLDRQRVVGLALTVALVLTSVAVVAWAPHKASPSGPAQLTSMPLPQTTLWIQNLEADRVARGVLELRHQDGTLAQRVALGDMEPWASAAVDLGALPGLAVGSYSASITSTGRIGVVARYSWPEPGTDHHESLAMSAAMAPGTDVIIPYVAISTTVDSTLVAVRNADPTRTAHVAIDLVAFGEDAPVLQQAIDVVPAGSMLLDFGTKDGHEVPTGFRGYARLRSDVAVSAQALVVVGVEESRPAYAAIEGMPSIAASHGITAFFSFALINQPSYQMALVNPGPEAADIALTYHIDPRVPASCTRAALVDQAFTLAPGTGRLIDPGGEVASSPGQQCFGVVSVDVTGGRLIAAMVKVGSAERFGPPYASGSAILGEPSQTLALPRLVQRIGERDSAETNSIASALNPGASDATVVITAIDERGQSNRRGFNVPADGSWSWIFTPTFGSGGVEDFAGSGLMEANSPLIGFVSEQAGHDIGFYPVLPLEAASSSAVVPFVARAPKWPAWPPTETAVAQVPPTPVTANPPMPAPGPTLQPPGRFGSFSPRLEPEGAGSGCCLGLAWLTDNTLLAVDIEDGVGWKTTRYNTAGKPLMTLGNDRGFADRIAQAPDGTIYVLGRRWGNRIRRFTVDGAAAGEVFLPVDRDLDIVDLAVAPDATLWLVDNYQRTVYHVGPDGDWLGSWGVDAGLRDSRDGAYRIALSPDGRIVYVLSWTRVLSFTVDGRLLAAWGGAGWMDPSPFESPLDLKVDALGRVYILEGTGQLRVLDAEGQQVALWTVFDENEQPPVLTGALAIGPSGRIAVSDKRAAAIHLYHPLPTGPFRPIAHGYLPLLSRAGRP